jgi:hypothetical protein
MEIDFGEPRRQTEVPELAEATGARRRSSVLVEKGANESVL